MDGLRCPFHGEAFNICRFQVSWLPDSGNPFSSRRADQEGRDTAEEDDTCRLRDCARRGTTCPHRPRIAGSCRQNIHREEDARTSAGRELLEARSRQTSAAEQNRVGTYLSVRATILIVAAVQRVFEIAESIKVEASRRGSVQIGRASC